MRLIERLNVGARIHRSGWPDVMNAVEAKANSHGLLLDDCVESSFLFKPIGRPHEEPWVGIFHFPCSLRSPLNQDRIRNTVMSLWTREHFKNSLRYLRGGIALCEELRFYLRQRLQVPMVSILHPTSMDVAQWEPTSLKRPNMIQVGYHLRNQRAIYHVPPLRDWTYQCIGPVNRWQQRRDKTIKNMCRPEVNRRVRKLGRLSNYEYDAALASSIVIMEVYGAAANNVVVECMARGTPLLVNRRPAIMEYLGEDYPLYFDDIRKVSELLDHDRIKDASRVMVERRGPWLQLSQFAADVHGFVEGLEDAD